MPQWTLTAKDTLVINGVQILDLGDKMTVHMEAQDALVNVDVMKNGNAIFAAKKQGQKMRMNLRGIIRGDVHTMFVTAVNQWISNPPAFVLFSGSFVKNVGDGAGNISHVSYVLSGGVPEKLPVLEENVEGETQQAIMMMDIMWASAIPVID